jgi:hypothetical protein
MILNLLRVEALRVEEMIKRSFSENASQRLLPDQQKKVLEVWGLFAVVVFREARTPSYVCFFRAGREEAVSDAEVGMRCMLTGSRRLLRHDGEHNRSQPTVAFHGRR